MLPLTLLRLGNSMYFQLSEATIIDNIEANTPNIMNGILIPILTKQKQ
ncbi:hypothetical protein Llab_2264 [Lactococcus lactis]|nr:hypothetical protein Llab_2264 [Lactococcus lactis]